MIGIFALYEKVRGRFNVHQGGHIQPSKFVEWVDDSQIELFNALVADYQKTQVMSDKITTFLVSANIIITSKTGNPWDLVKKPDGYEYFASARVIKKENEFVGCSNLKDYDNSGKLIDKGQCKYVDPDELEQMRRENDLATSEIPIRLVDTDRWGSVTQHPRKKPTPDAPIITQYSEGYKIAPKGFATAIIMDFFRRPVKPIFNFTVLNPGTEAEYIQYVPTGSVDLEWPETAIDDLVKNIWEKYAMFVGLPMNNKG